MEKKEIKIKFPLLFYLLLLAVVVGFGLNYWYQKEFRKEMNDMGNYLSIQNNKIIENQIKITTNQANIMNKLNEGSFKRLGGKYVTNH